MSTTNKKIVFEAQDSGVLSTFDQINQSAKNLTRELISGSQSYTTSGKEQLKYIEDQIKAIDRRNKADKERGVFEAKEKFDSSPTSDFGGTSSSSKEEYNNQVAELEKIYREDELQTQLMKQLVEEIKLSSQQEIVEDRKSVEKKISSDRRSSFFSGAQDGDPEENLKAALQKSLIGEAKESEYEDDRKFALGEYVREKERGINSGLAGLAENPIAMAAASVPFIGGVLALMASKGAQLDASTTRYGSALGTEEGSIIGAERYGLSDAEFATTSKEFQRSRGIRSSMSAQDMMDVSTRFDIGAGSLGQLASTRRSQSDQSRTVKDDVSDMLALFMKSSLFDIGPKNFTNLQEKIDFQNQLNQMQLTQTGSVRSTAGSARVQQAFGEIGGAFEGSEGLNLIQKANQGLSNPGNQYQDAFLLSVLQKRKPGSSLFDLREMQEGGIFQDNFMQDTMSELANKYGGKDVLSSNNAQKELFMTEIQNMFQLGYHNTRDMSDAFLNGTADFSRIGKDVSDEENARNMGVDLNPRAGNMDVLLAKISNEIAGSGKTAIDFISQEIAKMLGHDDGVSGYIGDQFSKVGDMIGESVSSMVGNIEKYFTDMVGNIELAFRDMLFELGIDVDTHFGNKTPSNDSTNAIKSRLDSMINHPVIGQKFNTAW